MWEGLNDGDIHVLMVLGHEHNSLVRTHWHGHMHGVWFILRAEHDLMPSLWGFCITLVLVTALHFICTLHGYRIFLGVRKDRPEGAYGSVVL